MIIKNLDIQTFDNYMQNHPQKSFWQTSAMSKRRMTDGFEVDYLGFYKEGTDLVGVASMFKRKVMLNHYSYECFGGPVIDYTEDTEEALTALAEYLENNKALDCRINPNLTAYIHNVEAGTKEMLNDFENTKQLINKTGFQYYAKADDHDELFNWFYKKDLSNFKSEKEIKDSFERETRRLVNLSLDIPLTLTELKPDQFHRLQRLLDLTADNKEFSTRDAQYYESMYKYFKESEDINFMLVSLNIKEYEKTLEDEIEALELKIVEDTEVGTKRALNRVNQNKDVLAASIKKHSLLEDIEEDEIDICAGVFLVMDKEIVYLLGGSDPKYFNFYGPQFMQWEMIKKAYHKGCSQYDFYGTRGNHCNRPDENGVYIFKKGFNGYLVENFGFYIYTSQSATSKLINGFRNIVRKIRS